VGLAVTKDVLRSVFDKTRGHCHFCGDALVLEHYGLTKKPCLPGAWELDHVIQRKKGGASKVENYLPACGKCNHLRWHRSGDDLRELILLGLVVKDEVRRGTELGQRVLELKAKRLERNSKRRV
jgi:hypothetical protein